MTKDILSDCKNTGERHAAEPLQHLEAVVEAGGGELHCLSTADVASCLVFPLLLIGHNVLIVAHASSLEACTRQLQGRSPQSPKDFIQVVRKVCSHSSLHLLMLSSGFLAPVPAVAGRHREHRHVPSHSKNLKLATAVSDVTELFYWCESLQPYFLLKVILKHIVVPLRNENWTDAQPCRVTLGECIDKAQSH